MHINVRHLTLYSFSLTCALMAMKYFHVAIPELLLFAAQGLVLIVAIGVFLVYTIVGPKELLTTLYINKSKLDLPLPILQVLDIVLHFIPPILLGLPTSLTGSLIACAITVVWYATFRNQIPALYIDSIGIQTYDVVMILSVTTVLLCTT